MNKEYKIGNLDLVVSDNTIEYGDFFIDLKKDGKPENYIHEYIDEQKDYVLNGVDVITLNKNEFEHNKNMCNYKRIENL